MKSLSTIPLINNNITANLSDASQGIVKINIDDEWKPYSSIKTIKLEIYIETSLGGHSADTNQVQAKVYDKINSADVTNAVLNVSHLSGKAVYQSADCKSYFHGKGEIEVHLKATFTNCDGNIYCARLVVEWDGPVEKFVEYQTCGVKWAMGIASYTDQLTPVLNLYASGNWDGTIVKSWCATLWTNAAGGTSYAQLYDGSSGQGEISSTSTTPEHKSSAVNLSDGDEYSTQQKVAGSLKTAYCALPLMIFKISGNFSKFEAQNVLNNYHENVTSTPWVEEDQRGLFDPDQWGDCDRAHYFETIGICNARTPGNDSLTRLTDDGVGISDSLNFGSIGSWDRLRTASFAEPAASSEIGWESDEQTDGYTKTSNNRHLILITNAVNLARRIFIS